MPDGLAEPVLRDRRLGDGFVSIGVEGRIQGVHALAQPAVVRLQPDVGQRGDQILAEYLLVVVEVERLEEPLLPGVDLPLRLAIRGAQRSRIARRGHRLLAPVGAALRACRVVPFVRHGSLSCWG